MNTYEDGPYDQDEPIEEVKCLLCGERMDRLEFEFHECVIVGWERV